MKKNVAAALAGALSLSLAAGVVAADKPLSRYFHCDQIGVPRKINIQVKILLEK